MNRTELINKLKSDINSEFDIIVTGGGATGLGIALDAASRGYKCILFEQSDFASGTSSRSTKLVHGGVRYMAQGDLLLVTEALRERGRLLKNAPALTRDQEFVIPVYSLWDRIKYTLGLKFYDLLAGRLSLGRSHFINKTKTLKRLPVLNGKNLQGGVVYHDGQFDDARLAIAIASAAAKHGAIVLNYFRVTELLKQDDKICGVVAIDSMSNKEYRVKAKVVINAAGVFADEVHMLDMPDSLPTIRPSQGVHIVLDRSFLGGNSAIMIPKTSDGRVLFGIPWYDKVVVGTTDTPVNSVAIEPRALDSEIDFILETAGQYLSKKPERKDIFSVFAGLRPLAADPGNPSSTKEVSRRHKITVSGSGLVSIVGGKWTTYRVMAEETIDAAIRKGYIDPKPCITKNLAITGTEPFAGIPLTEKDISYIIANEMPCTPADILSRRTRFLILDAKGSIMLAQKCAELLAAEHGYDKGWIDKQIEDYKLLVTNYL